MPPSPITQQPPEQIVNQIFVNQGYTQWWTLLAGAQRFNPPLEYGTDYQTPVDTPIHSITTGVVVYAQLPPDYYVPGQSSIGYVLQIENTDGTLIHYQHMHSLNVSVGDTIQVGDLLGYSGGCPADCYSSNGCSCGDKWSTGAHIEVRFSQKYGGHSGEPWTNGNWIDPVPIMDALAGSFPDVTPSQAFKSSFLNGLVGAYAKNVLANNPLKTNDGVAQTFVHLDQLLEFDAFWLDPLPTFNILGAKILDPIGAFQVYLNGIVRNIVSLVLVTMVLFLGLYIIFKVVNHLIDLTGKVGTALTMAAPFIAA